MGYPLGRRKTLCPKCHQPATLVSSRRVGPRFIPEVGAELDTAERKVECPCATAGHVHVAFHVEFYRGESTTWTVKNPAKRVRLHKI